MTNQTQELFDKVVDTTGWQLGVLTSSDDKKVNGFQRYIADTVLLDPIYPLDAIYFSGVNPFIYIKQLSKFDPELVRELQRKVWNEGRTPLLAVITPKEIKIIDCFDTPVEATEDLGKVQRESFLNTEEDLRRLASLLHQSKIDSGAIWNSTLEIKTQNRVDRKLVKALSTTRKRLHDEGLSFDIIHDLLGRSLFTLYLEDRGILNVDNYPSHPSTVKNFFDLLDFPNETYKLFHFLKERFNGDLFPVTEEEEQIIKRNPQLLKWIKNCFYGDVDLRTNQLSLSWRMFQFQYIPIELISAIYEEFMSEEDIEKNKLRQEGAFYTPQMLVEFVLNEVLPMPDENDSRYDLKILDPACGSGIFLVESFKRLIARWKFQHPNRNIEEDVLRELLLNNIFGIEKDTEAIKVTAFSLYLTYLNYIEPKKVLTQVTFRPLIKWSANGGQDRRIKQGDNLFQGSTFSMFDKEQPQKIGILENSFDLVIGNPPWKRGNLANDVKNYITTSKKKIPGDIVCSFLDYIPQIAPKAQIALISTAKVLFNKEGAYSEFRKLFFSQNKVEAIINFSVVRDVIFENAKAPAAVIIYKKRNEPICLDDEQFIYCVPKNDFVIKHRKSIVIDASEIKYIPLREVFKVKTKIFKVAMWGNIRDLHFIERLSSVPSIDSISERIEKGVGLHKKETRSPVGNLHLANHLFITPNHIQSFYTPKTQMIQLGEEHWNYRTNNQEIFNKPIILINEGSKNSDFCSSYIDYNGVYKSSTYGISLKKKSSKYHKALVACLNSKLANYYYFITSSSWGIDKGGRVQNNDAITFPALPEVMSEDSISELASKVDEIMQMRKSHILELNQERRVKEIKEEIDQVIFKELSVSNIEKALINDVLNYSIALKKRYHESKAETPALIDKQVIPYAKTLYKTIHNKLKNVRQDISVEVLDSSKQNDSLKAIVVLFNSNKKLHEEVIMRQGNISGLLDEINQYVYSKHSESIFYRKIIKYQKDNSIYIIKPNQKRFWSISQALNDADELMLDLMNS